MEEQAISDSTVCIRYCINFWHPDTFVCIIVYRMEFHILIYVIDTHTNDKESEKEEDEEESDNNKEESDNNEDQEEESNNDADKEEESDNKEDEEEESDDEEENKDNCEKQDTYNDNKQSEEEKDQENPVERYVNLFLISYEYLDWSNECCYGNKFVVNIYLYFVSLLLHQHL